MNHENRVDLSTFSTAIEEVRNELKKKIVGQNELIDLLMVALFANGHVLIEGVPGVAKTLTAKLLAKTLAINFSRIQFTPDLMPSDVVGTSVFNQKNTEFEFKQGPIFANVVLIDEINRAPAKTQSALFEVMEEHQVTNNGTTYIFEEPFMVLATQNPIEQEGTYRLPEAQLDRFLMKIVVEYPSLSDETEILLKHHNSTSLTFSFDEINEVLSKEKIQEIKSQIHQVVIEAKVIEYISKIVHSTRKHSSLYLGASPRASIALLSSSKVYAALQGRDFVTPEDIQRMALPVLRHRIMLTPEKEMEGISTDQVVASILQSIEVPR